MRRASITLRLTLLFGAASTAVLLGLGYVIGNAVEEHFVEQDRTELGSRVDLVSHVLQRVRTVADLDAVPQQLDDALVGQHDLSIAVVRANGAILFATSGTHFPQPLLDRTTQRPDRALVTWETNGHLYRGTVARLPVGVPGEPPARAAVALNIDHHRAFMHDFRVTLWIALAVGALVTALLGFIAARRGLGPVRAMAALTHRVTATRLADRVPLDTLPVELVDLGAAFNDMLGRLEDSFRRLSEFSSDLAHELRTPLSNLMTQTQVAVSRARSAEEYREILYSNLEELDRIARMIGDMLFLAKAENGLMMPREEVVALEHQASELLDFYGVLAEEQGVRLELEGEGSITGDRLMIRRALSNLISNALRHTPRGEAVKVAIEPEGDRVRVRVENRGAPIPAEHLNRIFDRFYRIDPARQRVSEGAGLGLAITKSIVDAHHGTIGATSQGGLTRFTLTFAAATAADPAHPAEAVRNPAGTKSA